ncbi:MAG: phosphate/phosphite/phosphonate ABC transporter substrate-binding protein [Planctomycetota bacterium]
MPAHCIRRALVPLLLLLLLVVLAAATPGCGPGANAFEFVDADGDLVCDTPTDPAKLIDPDTLVFAYTPLEDPATYEALFKDFLAHIEKVTGKKVRFFTVTDNAAQLEAMRSGHLHVTGFNTGSVPIAVNQCGFVPFGMMAEPDGSWGYQMELMVSAKSDIQSVNDLRGHTVAFTQLSSNSGYKVPSLLLRDAAGIDVEKDLKVVFSGGHDKSILGVSHGDYEAAPVAGDVLRRMVFMKQLPANSYRTIFKSEVFPTTGFGYVYNLVPALQAKIREAFFSYEWDAAMLDAFRPNGYTKFIPITYKEHWERPRKIDAALGVTYGPKGK